MALFLKSSVLQSGIFNCIKKGIGRQTRKAKDVSSSSSMAILDLNFTKKKSISLAFTEVDTQAKL